MDIWQVITEINQHISVLNDDYTAIKVDVGILKLQMASMVWWFRTIVAGIIALMLSQAWQVFHMKKNGNK